MWVLCKCGFCKFGSGVNVENVNLGQCPNFFSLSFQNYSIYIYPLSKTFSKRLATKSNHLSHFQIIFVVKTNLVKNFSKHKSLQNFSKLIQVPTTPVLPISFQLKLSTLIYCQVPTLQHCPMFEPIGRLRYNLNCEINCVPKKTKTTQFTTAAKRDFVCGINGTDALLGIQTLTDQTKQN